MGWMVVTARRSGRFTPVDPNDDDEERLINGFACEAEVRAFAIRCPACGALHQIDTSERHSSVFDQRRQLFRCGRCRFRAPVYVTVDCGLAPGEPERLNTQ